MPGTPGGFQVLVAAANRGGDALLMNAPIRDTVVGEGARISVQISADAFAHTNPQANVTLTATRADGAALPGWLKFDPRTGRFEGTPPPGVRGEVVVRVVARDQNGREATQTFKIKVGSGQGAIERDNQPGQGRGNVGRSDSADGRLAYGGRTGLTEQLRGAHQSLPSERMTALSRSAHAAMRARA